MTNDSGRSPSGRAGHEPNPQAVSAVPVTGEEWRAMPDYAGLYEVSSLGRVRSLHARHSEPKVLYLGSDKDGYPTVSMNKDRRRTTKAVHRLVCRAFHGEPETADLEAAHRDGDRGNPAASNLTWSSKVENHAHMRIHGTHIAGERHYLTRLTDTVVRQIKGSPASAKTLASVHGVSVDNIHDIRAGRTWAHILAEDAPTPFRSPPKTSNPCTQGEVG